MSAIDRRGFLTSAAIVGGTVLAPGCARAGSTSTPPIGPTLDELARRKGMRFGTAVTPEKLARPEIAAAIARECSVLLPANELKWRNTQPAPDRSAYARALEVLDFARQNQMQTRGHCFIWSYDPHVANWMKEREAELAANGGSRLIELMQARAERLQQVVPGIPSWDVVNEMIVSIGGEVRSSLYSRIFGEGMLDIAFGMMRETMPGTQLVYNDYPDWLSGNRHKDGILRLLESALARGVPIDAIGIQSHLETIGRDIDEADWLRFLEEVKGMGLKVLITELDCADIYGTQTNPAKRDAEIAAHVRAYLDLTLSLGNVEQVILWEFSDWEAYTLQPYYTKDKGRSDGLPMRAHLYDDNVQPKPVRQAIADALAAAPQFEK